MNWWQAIKNYYTVIGEKYQVDPLIFVGIHVIATPLFAAAVWWIIFNRKRKKSILIPSIVAVFIFNAASIYLIITGKNISFWIYFVVAMSAILSGYFTFKKIKKRIAAIE